MQKDPEKNSLLSHLLADRRYAAMLGLGFSAGIPYLLVYSTQSAWLSEAKVPIETIGLMSEFTIAYKFKFVWAPFLDKYDAPIFGALLGHRRGWIVLSQIAVMLALAGVAFGDPAHWLAYTAAFSIALGIAGATQDITIDGWRITSVPVAKQSVMTAISEMGYRVGTLAAGAGALLLADRYGWRFAYLGMAALITVGACEATTRRALEFDTGAVLDLLLDESFGQIREQFDSETASRSSSVLRPFPNLRIANRIKEVVPRPTDLPEIHASIPAKRLRAANLDKACTHEHSKMVRNFIR